MKTKIFCYLLFLAGLAYSQTTITIYENSKSSVVRYIPQGGGYAYAYSSVENIGRKDGSNPFNSGSPEDIYRSQHSFLLQNIPANATISSASIICYISGYQTSTYKMKVTKVSGTKTWGDLWSEINNVNTIITDYQYSSSGTAVPSTPLKDAINGARSAGTLYLGSLAQTENTNSTYALVELRLSVTYTVPPTYVSITAQNNFTVTNGKIIVDDVEQNSPYGPFSKIIGANVKLKAKEQPDDQGYSRIWTTSVPNEPSRWKKTVGGVPTYPANTIEYSFNADVNATYEAGLRRRYDISQNDQTDFDGTQSLGVVSQIVEQNSSTVTAPLSKTVNGKNYLFYKWSDGVTTNEKPISNPTDNQTVEAYYKAHFQTNANTNFETAGSHKFIRTGDGTLHLVYKSIHSIYNGHGIFYETSTDNGLTWQLRYSGVSYGEPAIAAVNNNRVVLIYPTYIATVNNILAVCYDLTTNSVLSTSSVLINDGANEPYDVNVAITTNGKILVTWYNGHFDPEGYYLQGYYARYGSINSSGVMTWLSNYSYEGSALASPTASHAAIDVRIHDGDGLFHFAFEDDDAYGRRQIYYCPLIYSGGVVQWYVYSPYNNCLSSSSGYENNKNPSFIPMSNEGTRFNWIGEFEEDAISIFKDPGYYRYWNFGYGVTSTSINKATDGYVIGWSNGYDQSYTNSSTLYELGNISSTGRYIQIGNSDYLSNMRAMGFNTASSPYVFNLSSPIGSMQKGDAQKNQVVLGRSGVISIQTQNTNGIKLDSTKIKKAISSFIQFAFTIDNVTVDGQSVKFIDIPEMVKPEDATSLNNYLATEPFAISDNSSLTYDVASSTTHSDKASEVLKQNRYVNFKVELIDTKTQQVIGVLNNSNNSETQIVKRQIDFLDIDCRGIKSREVQLRLVVTTNTNAQFTVTDKVKRLSDVLRKGTIERTKISFQGSSVVTAYALKQNYPNPFNPSTTINYQIPKDGFVTLKVFDALGREVATLVNEYKAVGYYSVQFDARSLSSGIYYYKINTEDFSTVRKMVLMK